MLNPGQSLNHLQRTPVPIKPVHPQIPTFSITMAASTPLQGIELIDCAKANAKQGIATASHLCGYGEDVDTFKQSLQQACQDIGVRIDELSDLIPGQPRGRDGVEFAPDTPTEL